MLQSRRDRMMRYSNLQIAIHWMAVAMIGAQWLTSGAIARTHSPLLPPATIDLFLHIVHNYNGMAIGFLVLVRIGLRMKGGSPRGWRTLSPLDMAATAVHWGIYASLAAQAATGFVASYLWGPAAGIHKALWNVTLTLVALHLSAAAWHGLRRDGVIGRMLPLKARQVSGERQRPVR